MSASITDYTLSAALNLPLHAYDKTVVSATHRPSEAFLPCALTALLLIPVVTRSIDVATYSQLTLASAISLYAVDYITDDAQTLFLVANALALASLIATAWYIQTTAKGKSLEEIVQKSPLLFPSCALRFGNTALLWHPEGTAPTPQPERQPPSGAQPTPQPQPAQPKVYTRPPNARGSYTFFQTPPEQVYGQLRPVRTEANWTEMRNPLGTGDIACDVAGSLPGAKIGIMIAANSGLPGGALGRCMKPSEEIKDGFRESLLREVNGRTQEESILAQMMLSGLGPSTGRSAKELVANFMWRFFEKWGLTGLDVETHTMTRQGIDFATAGPDKFNHAHLVQAPHMVIGRLKPNSATHPVIRNVIDAGEPVAPVHALVFADGPQASNRWNSDKGSMARTFCRSAANDYQVFGDCICVKLRSSLDAMASAGVTVPIVTGISTGIYAPDKFKDSQGSDIRRDIHTILTHVLNEQVGPQGQRRGQYFERVVFAKK